jgi:hypothetical protein
MLPLILKKICSDRGMNVVLSKDAPFVVSDESDGRGLYISKWDESALGPRPTAQEIAAVNVVSLQAEIAAEEQAETARREKLRLFAEWLRTQTDDVKKKFQDMQAEIDALRGEVATLKTAGVKLKNDLAALAGRVEALEAE